MLLAVSLASAPAYGQHAEVPEAYTLTAPHPNPFNPQTQFTLSVPEAQHVTVEVYNLLGRRVDVLHDGRLEAEQSYTFTFEAANEPSGIYLIRIIGKAFTATRRVTLLK
jgi:hypothetical protein